MPKISTSVLNMLATTVPADEAVLILCLHTPKHSAAVLLYNVQMTTVLADEVVLILSKHRPKICTTAQRPKICIAVQRPNICTDGLIKQTTTVLVNEDVLTLIAQLCRDQKLAQLC